MRLPSVTGKRILNGEEGVPASESALTGGTPAFGASLTIACSKSLLGLRD